MTKDNDRGKLATPSRTAFNEEEIAITKLDNINKEWRNLFIRKQVSFRNVLPFLKPLDDHIVVNKDPAGRSGRFPTFPVFPVPVRVRSGTGFPVRPVRVGRSINLDFFLKILR